MRIYSCIVLVGACGSPASTTRPPSEPDPVLDEVPVEVPSEYDPPELDSFVIIEDTGPVIDTGSSCLDLAEMVQSLFQQRCAACHSNNTAQYAGFAHVLDPAYLVDDGWVVPGSPADSIVLDVILNGSMPVGGPPVGQDGKSAVEDWIACGAEPWLP